MVKEPGHQMQAPACFDVWGDAEASAPKRAKHGAKTAAAVLAPAPRGGQSYNPSAAEHEGVLADDGPGGEQGLERRLRADLARLPWRSPQPGRSEKREIPVTVVTARAHRRHVLVLGSKERSSVAGRPVW